MCVGRVGGRELFTSVYTNIVLFWHTSKRERECVSSSSHDPVTPVTQRSQYGQLVNAERLAHFKPAPEFTLTPTRNTEEERRRVRAGEERSRLFFNSTNSGEGKKRSVNGHIATRQKYLQYLSIQNGSRVSFIVYTLY